MAKQPPPADRAGPTPAQRACIDRTDLSMAVTSGAGCGKTFVLTQRYLRLLDQDGRPDAPSRVVAVTFTDKAALEMRQRVAAELSKRTDPLAAAWRRNLTDARISTIHGFATSLLRAWPVEAGVDPAFTVLADEFRRTQMRQGACQEALLAALSRQSEAAAQLVGALGYIRVLDMLATLIDERWRWQVADYADSEKTLETWRQKRDKIAEAAWQEPVIAQARAEVEALANLRCADPADRLALHLAEQTRLMGRLLADPDSRTAEIFAGIVTAGNMGSAKSWGAKEQLVEIRHRLKKLVELFRELAPLHEPLNEADASSARLLAILTQTAWDAVRRYRAAKRRGGMLDFVDLQLAAVTLLRRRPAVRRRVAEGIAHLLIDEFQDTDSLQHDLLYLSVGADGPTPPPGRVFFVGDVKQSIYRFRGAEVEVFQQARAAIEPQARQNLDLNFRTHRHGVALVNRLFAPLLGRDYEPLVAHRTSVPDGPAAEVVLAECPDGGAYTRYRAGARATAERIAQLLASGEKRVWDAKQCLWRTARAGDVAILLPRLQNTGPFEDALDDLGVPYFVLAGAGLFNQQEVRDLISALRAIDNPLDDIALMGYLRGQLVGLDDNVLAHVAMAVKPPYRLTLRDSASPGGLPAALAQRLPAPAAARLAWAVSLLEELAAAKDACGPDALIRRLLARTNYEAVLLAQHQGRRKVGNVRRVLAHAAGAAGAGATLREFVEFVAGLTLQEVRAEQAATEAESGNVVRIMTIHKAKGLEFPVVFLADLNYQAPARFDTLSVRGPFGLTLRGRRDDDDEEADEPRSWLTAELLDLKAERAEDLRTFYVAVTRHRDFVAFVGAFEQTQDGAMGKSGSALRLLDEALGLDREQVELGDGATLLVRRVKPGRPQRRGRQSALDELYAASDGPAGLAVRLAELGVEHADPTALPLLTAPAAPPHLRIAPAALSLLAQCPAHFRWHYELRIPRPGTAGQDGPSSLGGLDGPSEEALLCRCLTLVDLGRPQRPELLLRQAAAEQGLTAGASPDAAELGSMLAALAAHPLWQTLNLARRLWRPVEFVTRTSRLEIAGTIDALLEDSAGNWQLVVFCADDVLAADAPACAEARRAQMDLLLAAGRRLLEEQGHKTDSLTGAFYFLRPAVAVALAPAPAGVEALDSMDAMADLLLGCRQRGRWPAHRGPHCRGCRYEAMCSAATEI